jgi:hypothetical protein
VGVTHQPAHSPGLHAQFRRSCCQNSGIRSIRFICCVENIWHCGEYGLGEHEPGPVHIGFFWGPIKPCRPHVGVFALHSVSAVMYGRSKARSEGRIHPTTQNSASYTCTRALPNRICFGSLFKRMCGHTYA